MKNRFLFTLLCGMLFLLAGCQDTASIGEYQSIPRLYESCPGECGAQLACEGQLVKVWGYLDQHNIFANAQNNNEVERFLIAQQLDDQGFAQGNRIEVYPPQGEDNTQLFELLNQVDESQKLFITGTAGGFDAPTNLACQKMITLDIDGEPSVKIDQE